MRPVHLPTRLTPMTALLLASTFFLAGESHRLYTGTHAFFTPRLPALRAALMGEDPAGEEVAREQVEAVRRMRERGVHVRSGSGVEAQREEDMLARRNRMVQAQIQADKELSRQGAPTVRDVITPDFEKMETSSAAAKTADLRVEREMAELEAEVDAELAAEKKHRQASRLRKGEERDEDKKDWLDVEAEGVKWVNGVPVVMAPIPSLRLLMRPFRGTKQGEKEED